MGDDKDTDWHRESENGGGGQSGEQTQKDVEGQSETSKDDSDAGQSDTIKDDSDAGQSETSKDDGDAGQSETSKDDGDERQSETSKKFDSDEEVEEEKDRSLYRKGGRPLKMEDNAKRRFRCRFGLKCKFLVLTILVVAYVVGGAWVFVALESPNQKKESDILRQATEAFYGNFTYLMDEFGVDNLTQTNLTIFVKTYVDDITAKIAPDDVRWDWTSGCFFCITVLTTIGYGRMSPRTQLGKIACLIYAVVGIPLFLIFLAKLGDVLVNAIRQCHRKCCGRKKKRGFSAATGKPSSRQSRKGQDENHSDADIPISPFIVVFILYIAAGSGMFFVLEKDNGWDFVDALYFVVVTFTTIGFGDLVPTYGGDGGLMKIKDLTEQLSDDLNINNINFNISEKEVEYIRHAEFALLIWYIIIGMVIMSCIFNLLLVRLRQLSDILSTKRRRDKFALNQNTFNMSGQGKIRKTPPTDFP